MKIPVVLISILALAATASAQIERKPSQVANADTSKSFVAAEPGDKRRRKDVMKDLDLTREQRAKLKELRDGNNKAKEAIENNSALSEVEKKRKLRELKKEQAEKMQSILTPEQREKIKANRQNNP